jgi:hypothetical protein
MLKALVKGLDFRFEEFQSADSRGTRALNGHGLSENCRDAAGDRGSSGIWIRCNPLLSL